MHAEDVYTLDPVVVTAERTDTRELKTPAAVEVMTAEDIRATGATSVHEALKFSTGIVMHAQGPRNISQGTMTNKAVIRGVEKGTLVLVDGVPLNQGGRYNLEDVAVDNIEKIEIVRGGGAVLYGSEAAGGVVNIITKGTRSNRVQAGFGNYGIQNYAASLQAGDFGFSISYDHTGHIADISKAKPPTDTASAKSPGGLYYDIVRGEHANFNWRYNFNDNLYFTHTYAQNSDHYRYLYDGTNNADNKGANFKDTLHSTEEHLAQLHFDNGSLQGSLYYNYRKQGTENYAAPLGSTAGKFDPYAPRKLSSPSGYTDKTVGMDVSHRWDFRKGSFMVGADFSHETEDKVGNSVTYERDMYSLYGQLAYDFTEQTRGNLNFRETWTDKDEKGNSFSKFTPEIVLMHDLDDQTMAYAKAGKSFMMPTFAMLYGGGNIIANVGLKPQSGNHYEVGLKKNIGKSAWRLAVYHYEIKDALEAKTEQNTTTNAIEITYNNEDVRNTGIELDWTRKQSDNFTYHLGISVSHPEKKSAVIEDGKTTSTEWHDYYGKLQFNAGMMYRTGKLTSSVELNYLGKRIRDVSPYESFKSQFFSNLNLSYQANEKCRFFLNVDNLFNRRDIVSTSSSTFYNLGRNFMAGMEYKF